jgi:hypothetical protein
MIEARRISGAFAIAILSAGALLGSCATKPASAAKAPSASAAGGKAAASSLPEISFPYRKPLPPAIVVATLHEPAPIARKAAEPAKASAPSPVTTAASSPAPAPAAPAPAATTPIATTPIATTPIAPSAAKAEAAAPKAASVVPKAAAAAPKSAPKAEAKGASTAKSEEKLKEPEPKNAASTGALAVIADPAADKPADISRNFSAVEGKRFEVHFEGTGWTYLGEKTLKEGIAYDSRRFEGSSLVFILNPIKAGDYLLRFQRQDALRGLAYEELVGVTVSPKPAAGGSASSAAAPASTIAPAPAPVATAAATAPATAATAGAAIAAPAPAAPASQAPASARASAPTAATAGAATAAASGGAKAPGSPLLDAASLSTPEAALAAARSEMSAGRVQGTLDALDRLLTLAPSGTDEAMILYARALEANGPRKDIKRAYAYYKKLRDDYPESPFWDEAAARASYIERHYFDIR